MICHERRFIFIHIPKCGGTSIEVALGHHGSGSVSGLIDHRSIRMLEQPVIQRDLFARSGNIAEFAKRVGYRWRSHDNAANKRTVNRAQFESYFKFAFVRNPWSRAYSWYRNVMRSDKHRQRLGVDEGQTFDEFLRRQLGRESLRSQLDWLTNYRGGLATDWIGKFEELESGYSQLCERLGIEEQPLPHLRNSGVQSYQDAYSPVGRDLIAGFYSSEIEQFGYEF